MKLTIKDRIVITQLFPKESDLKEMAYCKEIKEKVFMSSEEMDSIDFRILENGGMAWDDEKCVDKEIDFTIKEISFLDSQVDRLDLEKKITLDIVDICKTIKSVANGED